MMVGSRTPLGFQGAAPATIAPSLPATIAAPDMGPTAKIYRPGIRGVLQRADEAIKQPGMAAALLRSAGATFEGGIGAGIRAGASYMDGQQVRDDTLAQREAENAFREEEISLRDRIAQMQDAATWGNIAMDGKRLSETVRHNRAGETLEGNQQRIQLHGINTGAVTAANGHQVQLRMNQQDNNQSNRNSERAFKASVYGDDVQAFIAGLRPAGIGSKTGTVTTKMKIPAKGGGWFGGATTPAQEVTTEMPYSPPTAAPRPGDVVDGMTFLGGDPRDRLSWR